MDPPLREIRILDHRVAINIDPLTSNLASMSVDRYAMFPYFFLVIVKDSHH